MPGSWPRRNWPDIDRAAVARADGGAADALAAALVAALHEAGRIDVILGLGGSGGTALVTAAMRALPVGVPKLMVSTVASGDTRAYVGATDVTMMFSVVDIAGINRFSARILDNAAAAIGGMARAYAAARIIAPTANARRCSA